MGVNYNLRLDFVEETDVLKKSILHCIKAIVSTTKMRRYYNKQTKYILEGKPLT